MRNFFIGISMLVLTNLAFAQQYNQQDAYCAPSIIIVEELLRDFKEIPMLTATNNIENETLVFFANPETTTWTIVIFNADMSLGCAVISGKNYKPFNDQASGVKS